MKDITKKRRCERNARPLDIPLGRIEFMGQVLHIVEHQGRLVAACNDEYGMPFEALGTARLNARACRDLMHEAVDLLIQAADLSLMVTAFAAGGTFPCHCRREPLAPPTTNTSPLHGDKTAAGNSAPNREP